MKTITTQIADDGSSQPSEVSVSLHLASRTEINREQAVAKVIDLVKAAEALGLVLEGGRGESVEIQGITTKGGREWEFVPHLQAT